MSDIFEILTELHQRGVSIAADGNDLILKPRCALDDSILGRIREAKPAILKALKDAWPEQSEPMAQRFGQAHERLFPLIGKQVWTPLGVGKLFSAYAERCEVVLNGTVFSIPTEEVRPIQ